MRLRVVEFILVCWVVVKDLLFDVVVLGLKRQGRKPGNGIWGGRIEGLTG
jgi:hypothetical protein